jgi:hypothetical protein
MVRRLSSCAAVLALLQGFWAAPYTHAHRSTGTDEHRPHGHSVVHTHAAPHSHDHPHTAPHPDDPDDGSCRHDADERVWSVDSFVCGQPAAVSAAAPALVPAGTPTVALIDFQLSPGQLRPRAHGPPSATPCGLRAPPAFLPAFA